ncbi:hypothetical protein ACHBTE_34340 [Streptomyces sp. M41]|uniref:hypothetical protein n=1 Tax=Streptomyces sp. M41 TaxID=3059412 RepID=UPI00374DAC90
MTDAITGKGAGIGPAGKTEPVAATGGVEHPPAKGLGGGAADGGRAGVPFVSHDESDTFELKLQHAVATFVDRPRAAVEEADHVLEELAARFTEAVTQRRRTLRGTWQSADRAEGATESSADTEQLRLALRDYRELAERLLHV